MPRVLVIGFGNRLRGDDGVGPQVAEAVAETYRDNESVRCLSVPQLTPELAEDVSAADAVVFIDADAEAGPGTIRRRDVRPATLSRLATCHTLTPSALCALGEALYGSAPSATLLSVGAAEFDCSDRLSAEVRAVFPELLEAAEQAVSACLRGREAVST